MQTVFCRLPSAVCLAEGIAQIGVELIEIQTGYRLKIGAHFHRAIFKVDIRELCLALERQKTNISALPVRDGAANAACQFPFICIAEGVDKLAGRFHADAEMQFFGDVNVTLLTVRVGVRHTRCKNTEQVIAIYALGVDVCTAPAAHVFRALCAEYQSGRVYAIGRVCELDVCLPCKCIGCLFQTVVHSEVISACVAQGQLAIVCGHGAAQVVKVFLGCRNVRGGLGVVLFVVVLRSLDCADNRRNVRQLQRIRREHACRHEQRQ